MLTTADALRLGPPRGGGDPHTIGVLVLAVVLYVVVLVVAVEGLAESSVVPLDRRTHFCLKHYYYCY